MGNAACSKTVDSYRQCHCLKWRAGLHLCLGTVKKSTMKAAGWSDRTGKWILEQCWYGVNSGKINFCRMRKFKLFGQRKYQIFAMYNRSRISLFSSEVCSCFSLLLKAIYNSLRHSLLCNNTTSQVTHLSDIIKSFKRRCLENGYCFLHLKTQSGETVTS